MKLLLLRHAKSSWNDEDLADFDRPLSDRGIKDCKTIKNFIKKNDIYPDLIISSSSKRTKETINLIFKNHLNKIKIIYTKKLYLAGANKIINIISKTNDKKKKLMIVAHNPGLLLLVDIITGQGFPYKKFSTTGLALIDINIKSWSEIKSKTGKLSLFMTPKMIRKKN
ncbi:MAG: histidine phosphatase family protein [Spirochaetes bacterium]|nr:histidine phosphatase family protein [Spirochaetota bacterium]